MIAIPLQATPNQTLTIVLGTQTCQLNVYQNPYGVFMDVFVNHGLIIGGVLCHNKNIIVRSGYLGFVGDLLFVDTQGTDDPDYTGFGTRFQLLYLEPADM
jgi:hypothetical protein